MGSKVKRSISEVFWVVGYKFEVRISKLKMANQYGDLAYNILVSSGFFYCNCLENSYEGF